MVKEVNIMAAEKKVKLVFDTKGKSLNEVLKQILISKAR